MSLPPGPPLATDSTVSRLIVTFTVLCSLAGITMAFRFYCKYRYVKKLGIDDLLLGLSYVCLPFFLFPMSYHH